MSIIRSFLLTSFRAKQSQSLKQLSVFSLNKFKLDNFRLYSTNSNQGTEEQIEKKVSKVRIYTRTGDKGKSSLFTGERRPKNDVIFEALGNSDELNSSLGLAREFCMTIESEDKELVKAALDIESKIIKIQSTLLDIGSYIATPPSSASQSQLDRLSTFNKGLTKELEEWIDTYEQSLPVLRNFILPSGGKCASTLHLSRSICRRFERSLQPLIQNNDLDPNILAYVNRYIFFEIFQSSLD